MQQNNMLTQKNYYTDKEYISYHDILDFLKCEYLFHKRREGEAKRIERDYFTYGNAFDSMLTGDFQKDFVVGKSVNVEERKAIIVTGKQIGRAHV